MNSQDKAREPSMDEILASIRQIIAEEPSEARADGETASSNPLLTGTELRASNPFHLEDRPRPSADRLSSALRARATAPPPPPSGASRPMPFAIASTTSVNDDNDLTDLLDEPSSAFNGTLSLPEPVLHRGVNGAPSLATAKPYLNGSHVLADIEDLPPEGPEIVIAKSAEEATQAIAADAAQFPQSAEVSAQIDAIIEAVLAEPVPTSAGEPVPSVPPAPPPSAASPWESMRKKNGFWPPKNNGNVAANAPLPPASQFPGSGAFPPPEAQRATFSAPPVAPSAPSETAELVARLHAGLSETPVPVEPQTPPSQLQFAAPLGSGGATSVPPMNGAHYAPPQAPNGYATSYAAPRAPEPRAPEARVHEPAPIPAAPPVNSYAPPMSTDALMEAAFAALTGASQPSSQPRDAYGRPLAAEPRQSSYTNPYAPGYGSRPDPAAAALDALAQGLAAPQRVEPLHRAYDTYQSAPSHAPTALVPQPLPPAIQEYYPQAIRTLEDSVADMLKPLLQKWLADNMPRIIERALRVEAASGMKPPGSS